MVEAMQFQRNGGPDVLESVTLTLAKPGAGEVRLRHTAIGLNYIDTYHRSGLYPTPLPTIPGSEAAGMIEEIGPNVSRFVVGDRVAYARGPLGAYTQARNIAAKELVKIPDAVDDITAAASMLKGLTAWYLSHQTFPLKKGDTILVHAAAGGVGLLLCQWASFIGARVIGTAGSADKAALARENGASEVILYRQENVAEKVRAITHGAGVDVVYDAVGKDTFTGSLDSLKPLGLMVSYGQASGPIPPFALTELGKRGSLYITRPSLKDYMREDAVYHKAAAELFARIAAGDLRIHAAQQFALSDAVLAHQALESRQTTGSTVLIP